MQGLLSRRCLESGFRTGTFNRSVYKGLVLSAPGDQPLGRSLFRPRASPLPSEEWSSPGEGLPEQERRSEKMTNYCSGYSWRRPSEVAAGASIEGMLRTS
jgi:hypothetical protein